MTRDCRQCGMPIKRGKEIELQLYGNDGSFIHTVYACQRECEDTIKERHERDEAHYQKYGEY